MAVARSAGIRITPRDFAELSETVPLLAEVYPNGKADVNRFQALGGPSWIIRELLAGGYMHPDVTTVAEEGISAYTRVPELAEDGTTVQWPDLPAESGDDTVVRTVDRPFSLTGGLKLLTGNLGNSAFIKVSAVPAGRLVIEAPAAVFSSQEEVQAAYDAGELNRDVVVVVRFQGPRANGMPELHKLSDPLGNLQNGYTDRHGTVHDGFRVALVTDGRMSGASGKVPAAIHVSHEALAGGPLAKVRNGDIIRLDAEAGTLNVLVNDDELDHRPAATITLANAEDNGLGFGRELFRVLRENALPAEEGACTW